MVVGFVCFFDCVGVPPPEIEICENRKIICWPEGPVVISIIVMGGEIGNNWKKYEFVSSFHDSALGLKSLKSQEICLSLRTEVIFHSILLWFFTVFIV